MRILVLNSGSSSVKYALFEFKNKKSKKICNGIVDEIGSNKSNIIFNSKNKKIAKKAKIGSHEEAIKKAFELIVKFAPGKIDAVGHRVVHGGELKKSKIVEKSEEKIIEKYEEFAPLHNPYNLLGIKICKKLVDVPQIAVFDTAFHSTLPPKAFFYAIPYEQYSKFGIRRYGFHGTSHKYVSKKAAEILQRPLSKLNLITLHLGNGASVTAVKNGKSIDTSMGFSPLEGLIMGTRSGDLDPAVVLYLIEREKMSVEEVNRYLNEKSGLFGVSGISNDMRKILSAKKTNKRAELAFEMFCYRAKKYIGAYYAALGRVDAIVFTAGIGENAPEVREKICGGLGNLGIELDKKKNKKIKEGVISRRSSKVKILVIKTDEEKEIAEETYSIMKNGGNGE